MQVRRREFVAGMLSAGIAGHGVLADGKRSRVRFLVMSDTHVERDFLERGHAVYQCWKPGNHLALEETYKFINTDPRCANLDFAIFLGDQLNTGYSAEQSELDAELGIWNRTLLKLDIHSKTLGSDLSAFNFKARPWVCKENLGKGAKPFAVTPPKLNSKAIVIQGNHDTGVKDFYRDCAFTCGNVRVITFFASYVALPPPPGKKYHSTGFISDETADFVTKELESAAMDSGIEYSVLACHWAIAPAGKNFRWPIVDGCKSNKYNENRRRILEAVEKYGCGLYLNGHEHNDSWPAEKVGGMLNVNCGTVTAPKSSFAIAELGDGEFRFDVYSRAVAKTDADGKVVVTSTPEFKFSRRHAIRKISKA